MSSVPPTNETQAECVRTPNDCVEFQLKSRPVFEFGQWTPGPHGKSSEPESEWIPDAEYYAMLASAPPCQRTHS